MPSDGAHMQSLADRSSWRRTLRAFIRAERASAMVEFAIVVSLLMALIFGTIDWSRYFISRSNLINAVRDGARYAATLTESAADTVAVRTYTRALISGTAGTQALGLVKISFTGTAGVDRRVRVALDSFPFTPATFLVMKSAKKINVAAEFRREQP